MVHTIPFLKKNVFSTFKQKRRNIIRTDLNMEIAGQIHKNTLNHQQGVHDWAVYGLGI